MEILTEGNRLVMSGVGDCRVVLLEGEGKAGPGGARLSCAVWGSPGCLCERARRPPAPRRSWRRRLASRSQRSSSGSGRLVAWPDAENVRGNHRGAMFMSSKISRVRSPMASCTISSRNSWTMSTEYSVHRMCRLPKAGVLFPWKCHESITTTRMHR